MIDDHYCHSPKKIWLDVIKTDVHVTIVIDDVIYVISDWSAKKSGPFRFGVDEKTTWDRHSRCERLLLVFIAVAAVSAGHHLPTWRIHGAGIFMVLHGSHEYTPLMLAYIYIYHTWIRNGNGEVRNGSSLRGHETGLQKFVWTCHQF